MTCHSNETPLLNLGALSQMVSIVGYIPQDLTYSIDKNDNYKMKFNIRTFDNDGYAVFVPCVAFGNIAKTLYDQFSNRDSLAIWGQLKHVYNEKIKEPMLYVSVLSYSIMVEMDFYSNDGKLSIEKQEFLKRMSDRFDKNQPPPTEDEIQRWRDIYRKRSQKYKKR